MKKLNLIIIAFFFITACHSEKTEYSKEIVGEWAVERDEKNEERPISPFKEDPQLIIFEEDGTYIDKKGFYKFEKDKKTNENNTLYFGEKTRYKIKGDSLLIFNPAENNFNVSRIVSMTKSKIILEQKNKSLISLVSYSGKKFSNPPIDKIIVSKSPCLGSCAINSSIVDNSGNLFFYGESYNSKNGFYKNTVSNQKSKEVFNELQCVDINNLKTEYTIPVTDLSSESITFVLKGKIIKTVYNYGNASPFELRRLIRNISYLYQNIPLKRINLKDPLLLFNMRSKTHQISFTGESESFYLFHELLKSNPIIDSPKELPYSGKYRLSLPENDNYEKLNSYERTVTTDGKIFKVQQRDYTFKTFDLGYNFFIKNDLITNKGIK
ncbi:DUF6438 domain-containing protein [Chryseobacterium sp. SSA4.19]|uniref:DUF6438 domain-containing protein n=1 Tax=Chryseobacterium sp. SSA4.19 TaxID=2919915 RepID=UPI001F4EE981|nr:DUF6438 domain-containing protein [Chryseobacterium sp. SSA4.19]MCJ8153560.1 DUF6438 domain-containing protein [Chryseobacterium sp. SSA4.19]